MRAVPLCVYSVIIYFMAGKNDAVGFVGVQSLDMLIRHWRHYDMHRSYGRSHSIHQRMPFCRLNRWNHKNLSSGQPLIVTVTLWHLQILLHCAPASCGAVYCYRSCLWVCDRGRAGGVCYHDNSKLPASIFSDLHQTGRVGECSSHLQLIKFGGPAPPGRGLRRGEKIWLRLLPRARNVCVSLSVFSLLIAFAALRPLPVLANSIIHNA